MTSQDEFQTETYNTRGQSYCKDRTHTNYSRFRSSGKASPERSPKMLNNFPGLDIKKILINKARNSKDYQEYRVSRDQERQGAPATSGAASSLMSPTLRPRKELAVDLRSSHDDPLQIYESFESGKRPELTAFKTSPAEKFRAKRRVRFPYSGPKTKTVTNSRAQPNSPRAKGKPFQV